MPVQKIIDSTFCDLDLTKFDKVKDHDGYLINKMVVYTIRNQNGLFLLLSRMDI